MSTVPLDPASPRGIELTAQLTQIFAEVRLAIWKRGQSKPPKQGTPPPARPKKGVKPPRKPKKGQAA